MSFGNFDFNLRKSGGDFLRQHGNRRIFRVKMSGINQVQAQFPGIPKLVVFDIRSDKGIAARSQHIQHPAAAAAAAHGDFMDGPAAVHAAQTFTAEIFLHGGKEASQRLLGHIAAAHKSDSIYGIDDLYIFKSQLSGQNIVDAAGGIVQIGVGVNVGDAFAIKDNVEIAKSQGISITASGLCGGGAKSKLWQKILCNVLNITVNIPKTEQGPGFGGAMLAMVGDGRFESVRSAAEKFADIKETVTPNTEIAERYAKQYEKFKEIYPSVKELFKKIK